MNYPRIILAGTHSGVGKTTITMGLIAALRKRGFSVQPYKTGPDYIDPGYHTSAAGRKCRNLDSMLLSSNRILESFARNSRDTDLSVIEGVMGLFDGAGATDERGSTSSLSKILKAPVLLVINARAMSRSAGALAWGYARFERGVKIAGFILNNIGSENHYSMVKQSIETKTGIPVVGYLPKDTKVVLPERHLGLVPAAERGSTDEIMERLASLVEEHFDLDRIIGLAKSCPDLPHFKPVIFGKSPSIPTVRIGMAHDEAFNFYYEDNIDILRHYGAEIVPFSPLKDRTLPEGLGGIYMGGGFPEIFAADLSKNRAFREELLRLSRKGMPILAECGGLMYLVEKLEDFEGREHEMTGIFPGIVRMGKRLRSLGYCEALQTEDSIIGRKGMKVKGHMFHWSWYDDPSEKARYIFEISKSGKTFRDGLVSDNSLASYLHLHFSTRLSCAKTLIRKAGEFYRKDR